MQQAPARLHAASAGFTIVELMLVIGIVALLVSVLTLGIRQAGESFALRRAAETVVSEVRRAQAGALAERTDYTVEFVLGTPGGLRVSRPKPATEMCPAGMMAASTTRCERVVAPPEQWPPSVSVVADSSPPAGMASLNAVPSCSAAGAGNKCVTFQFLGAPGSVGSEAAGTILLQSLSGAIRRIAIAAGTGKVSVLR